MKLRKNFFKRKADIAAKELLGKILVREINGDKFMAKIVEVEAYFDEKDPASWARFGKRKDNLHMWSKPGTILIKNVHKYNMLNFSVDDEGIAGAVLIRALEPLNFKGNTRGPGLLTIALKIDKSFNGKYIFEIEDFWIEDSKDKFEICDSRRVGVKEDLNKNLRFYIKDNLHISKK